MFARGPDTLIRASLLCPPARRRARLSRGTDEQQQELLMSVPNSIGRQNQGEGSKSRGDETGHGRHAVRSLRE